MRQIVRRIEAHRRVMAKSVLRRVTLSAALLVCASWTSRGDEPVSRPAAKHGDLPLYVTTAAIHRMMLKSTTKYWRFEHLSLKPDEAADQLKALSDSGVTAIEIFAPEEGENSYDGLDAKNRYRLDPGVGSIDEFRNVVKLAHSLGMHVIAFENLGYSSVNADQFLKAADDERAGKTTRETAFYYWSDRSDAPAPGGSNSYFFVRPVASYNPTKNEFWQWSERAQKYYWTRHRAIRFICRNTTGPAMRGLTRPAE